MNSIMKFIEINYYYHGEFSDPEEAIRLHGSSNLFVAALLPAVEPVLVKHIDHQGEYDRERIRYVFFRAKNKFTHIPFRTHRFIDKERPAMVLVQGLIFPLQVIALRMKLGRRCIILLQHHGEVPFRRKRFFQRIADRCVNGYLFTSLGNTGEWRTANIIRDGDKCFEMPSSSTQFSKSDKALSKERRGMRGNFNFLWVGRLNTNKDPSTVIAAFARYAAINTSARLYMIFQEDELLDTLVKEKRNDPLLNERLVLLGRLDHAELEDWYNAADYFISGSHREGGSYALTEAMACGCIPIVTDIPASMKAIDSGKAGYYYPPGDRAALFNLLAGLREEDQHRRAMIALQHFRDELSPEAIAKKLLAVYRTLAAK